MSAGQAKPLQRYYRCYFLGRGRKIGDFVEFFAASDEFAVLEALSKFSAQNEFSGFELWEGARRVHSFPDPAPPGKSSRR